jgi:hypothetical protein
MKEDAGRKKSPAAILLVLLLGALATGTGFFYIARGRLPTMQDVLGIFQSGH